MEKNPSMAGSEWVGMQETSELDSVLLQKDSGEQLISGLALGLDQNSVLEPILDLVEVLEVLGVMERALVVMEGLGAMEQVLGAMEQALEAMEQVLEDIKPLEAMEQALEEDLVALGAMEGLEVTEQALGEDLVVLVITEQVLEVMVAVEDMEAQEEATEAVWMLEVGPRVMEVQISELVSVESIFFEISFSRKTPFSSATDSVEWEVDSAEDLPAVVMAECLQEQLE